MMSLGASGTLADAITFSIWKGRPYVRERVIPSNPKSGAQIGRRAMLKFLSQYWTILATADKATWQDLADEIVASPFHAYIKQNLEYWHNFLSPSQVIARAQVGAGSNRAITTCAWEENRIKISTTATIANQYWGIIYFASLTTPIVEAVGKAIIVELDIDLLARDTFWTPPSVATWYFDSMTFSDDGVLSAAGGEQSAVPP